MASRKEEKERLRAQRLAAERAPQSSGQRRLIAGYVVAGILALAVVAGPGRGDRERRRAAAPRRPRMLERAHQELRRDLPRASSRIAARAPRRRRSRSPTCRISAQKAGLRAEAQPARRGQHPRAELDPGQLQDRSAHLGQSQPGADRRRGLHDADRRSDTSSRTEHPQRGPRDGARASRDPLQAEPARGPAAGTEGRLRRGPGRDAALPRPGHALRRRRHRLDQRGRLPDTTTRASST